MAQPSIKYITEAEYLAFERESQERHEYYKGEIYLMSGASFKHNIIDHNLRGALHTFLKGKKCRSFGSNLRIHIPPNTLYAYPDILIVCDKPQFLDGEFDTLLNPTVLIEILSPSTGNYDRVAKFDLTGKLKRSENIYLLTLQQFILFTILKMPTLLGLCLKAKI